MADPMTIILSTAFTTTTLPNIVRFPAFVAGFFRVLIMQTPGIVNFAFFFSSAAERLASASRTFEHSLFFRPVAEERPSATPPLLSALDDFAIAIAFIGAMTDETLTTS